MYIRLLTLKEELPQIVSAEYMVVTDKYIKAFFNTHIKCLIPNAMTETNIDEINLIDIEKKILILGRHITKPNKEAVMSAKKKPVNLSLQFSNNETINRMNPFINRFRKR